MFRRFWMGLQRQNRNLFIHDGKLHTIDLKKLLTIVEIFFCQQLGLKTMPFCPNNRGALTDTHDDSFNKTKLDAVKMHTASHSSDQHNGIFHLKSYLATLDGPSQT